MASQILGDTTNGQIWYDRDKFPGIFPIEPVVTSCPQYTVPILKQGLDLVARSGAKTIKSQKSRTKLIESDFRNSYNTSICANPEVALCRLQECVNSPLRRRPWCFKIYRGKFATVKTRQT